MIDKALTQIAPKTKQEGKKCYVQLKFLFRHNVITKMYKKKYKK